MKYFNIDKVTIPVSWQPFVLSYDCEPESFGWDKKYVEELLFLETNYPSYLEEQDSDVLNDIAVIYDNGVGVEKNIQKAIHWYQLAIEKDNKLAMSNLADILRKGVGGTKINLPRAFELYKACGLPYGHYRVGEFYEKGWGVEKNLEMSKIFYTFAWKEGHPLAKKKLSEWNFLE